MDEPAPDGPPSEQIGQFREIQQPFGIPRRPVRVVAVDDSIDDVMRLGRLVQEARGRLGPGANPDTVLDDLKSRGLDVSRSDVTHVWDSAA